MGVKEVHLQRLVFDEVGYGMAAAEQFAVRKHAGRREGTRSRQAQAIGAELGVDAGRVGRHGARAQPETRSRMTQPWATCRRPWSLMYFTAHGRALPCCIAPFSVRGYSNYTLGDATQQTLREIWNSPAYREFRSSLAVATRRPRPARIAACDGACSASLSRP